MPKEANVSRRRPSRRTSPSRSIGTATSTGTTQLIPDIDGADGAIRKIAAVQEPQPEVHIRGDQDARYEFVGRVVFACQRAGIAKIGFITEPPPQGRLIRSSETSWQ